jgi:hypothetical protein
VPILEIHGTNDNVTYYDGDPNNNDGWGAYPSIPETIDFFVNLFGLGRRRSLFLSKMLIPAMEVK